MLSLGPTRSSLVAVKRSPVDSKKGKMMTVSQTKPNVEIMSVKPPGATEHSVVMYPYTHPESNYDNPAYWSAESSYFGLGADTTATSSEAVPWYTTLATGAMNLYQQYLLSQQNKQRAQAGMPPLSAQDYAATQIPPARAQVGLDPETRKLLLYGGLGLGTVLVVLLLTRKKS